MRLHSFISSLLLFLITISMVFEETLSLRRDMTKLLKFQEKIQERLAVAPTLSPVSSPPSSHSPKMVGKVIYPIGYGADPTGGQDSSDAMLEALTDAFQLQTGLEMLPRVADLGGLVIDLQGGSYMIGKPLRFPSSGGGNLVVKGGTFRASEVFPGDRHLVELVASNSGKPMKVSPEDSFSDQKDQNSGISYEDVTFQDVLFDSSFRGGGILVIDSARIRITNCYFLHFTTQGIKVQGGHETYISNSFLGQHSTVGGDRGERGFTGTGIDISSNDNAITDVVIFSAGIGISLNGGANMVTGVHCYNKATWFGGIGILVKAHLTRIDNCYLDYTGIVIEDPVHVHVTNALFLGDANIVLRSVHGRISGVNIVNNMFSGTAKNNFPIVKLEGEFHDIDQVVIDQNNAEGMTLKSTTGKATVSANGTRWVADFSPVLVFPNRINHYQHSFFSQSGQIPANAVTNVSNNVVVVETDRAVTGTVSVIVYQ
ncbi:PREDICTED: polygalacturonase QRT3-like [Camelina sativa]|uniref:Polygalacturonase QRT3-like n=1 Tax=Camelina sativa TaxID=90675 RepID=A0ABM0U161_CAMSA|nr:PREDICTED: polygalacturonase QRT3-like [Camelina sativa]